MSTFPGDKSFEQINPSIFRVETRWANKRAVGTGFVLAMFANSKKLVLATAKHVLDFPDDETIAWKVQQFDGNGEVARQVTFGTNAKLKGDVPYRTHNLLDVGIVILPALGDDKATLARAGEAPVRAIDILSGSSTGTRVAWAGFPGIVENALGFPQVCYFEGVIAAMVNRPDRQLYIVDGHGAPGVSGGPVWHWSLEKDRLEVVGIVCGYQPGGKDMPGFCFFEPINPILYYFESEPWHPDKVGDHLITNRRG